MLYREWFYDKIIKSYLVMAFAFLVLEGYSSYCLVIGSLCDTSYLRDIKSMHAASLVFMC